MQVISAPQSWFAGCMLASPEQNSYDPNTLETCPGSFSQQGTWAEPSPLLAMPTVTNMTSIAPNSGAGTSVATAAVNGGTDGTATVAASPASAQPGQALGPASMIQPFPSIIPSWWNNPPQPQTLADRMGQWACQNPALAAVAVAGLFLICAKGGVHR